MAKPNFEGCLTVDDVAKRWAVTVKTVRRLIRQNRIGAIRVGRRVRITPEQVRAFERRNALGGLA